MPKVCEACGQVGADKRCSRCMGSVYCSIECQRKHWKAGHKHKCAKAEKPSAAKGKRIDGHIWEQIIRRHRRAYA
jgi:hypothetical protein